MMTYTSSAMATLVECEDDHRYKCAKLLFSMFVDLEIVKMEDVQRSFRHFKYRHRLQSPYERKPLGE